jgi:hypothetical protein
MSTFGSRGVGLVSAGDITGFRTVGINAGRIGIMSPGIGNDKTLGLRLKA